MWSNIEKEIIFGTRSVPLGKNDVGKLFSKAAQNNDLQGRLTNHCDCKSCVSKLLDLDIPVIYVAQLSASLREHEKSRFIQVSIHSTSAKNVVNNELLSKCSANKCQVEFPYA